MESHVDASLLVNRFPTLSTADLGQLVKDFFCARSVGSGTYGGRLFVMENALVFVSTYSNSKSYDCCIPVCDVTMATAIHRNVISSLEVEWSQGKECFNNFYNLNAIEKTLSEILTSTKLVVKNLVLSKGVVRTHSVPASTSPQAPLRPKAEPCHFFSKCGFCPRRVLCKLDHTYLTKQLSADVGQDSSRTHYQRDSPTQCGVQRLPLKKIHIDMSSGIGEECAEAPKGASLRSTSLPSSSTHLDDKQNGCGLEEKTTQTTPTTEFVQFPEMARNLPKSFNFTSQFSQQLSSSSIGEEFHTSEGEFMSMASGEVTSPESGDVFLFSSSPTGTVQKKRRDARVSPGTSLPMGAGLLDQEAGPSEGRSETASMEVAMLTQQLELGSDNDSLHGDLDIEAQMRIMETFSQGNQADLPPPYDAVVSRPLISPSLSIPDSSSPPDQEASREGHGQKRQPCSYFLSGYCEKGTECPNYHGMGQDLEELEYDDISLVPIPDKMKVYSGAVIGRGDLNSGDKIILPPHILIACEQQQLDYPMAFKMESTVFGKTVYGGVLQFTSPAPDSAYLPQWMMEHLQAKDGEEVTFKHVDLPKGEFVQLQPVSSSWLAIPYDKRMAVMEFQLRNFQTLTEGTKVTLTYELNKYTLKVLQCRPAKGISIVDSDLTTDVIEPADLRRFHSVEEGQAENLELEESKSCSVKGNAYRHYVLLSLPGKPLPTKLRVEVESTKGDADLFLSQSFATPTQSRYTWCNQDVGRSVLHMSNQDDKNYEIQKPLYVGVMGVFEDADFSIAVHSESSSSPNGSANTEGPSPSGQTLRGLVPSEATPSQSEPLPGGHQRCSHCGSVMPALRLLLHERHCAQSTFKCPLCQLCFPKALEKKHNSISHQLLVCECGQEYSQLALHRHQEVDCNKRMVNCPFKWCNLAFPMDQLTNHESICGRKKVECPVCSEEVSQLEMKIHLEAFHNVLTDTIDWSKPLANQTLLFKPSESNFKCPCGKGFEFQDDFQVHQLTECTFRRIAQDQEVEGGVGLLPVDVGTDIVG